MSTSVYIQRIWLEVSSLRGSLVACFLAFFHVFPAVVTGDCTASITDPPAARAHYGDK